MRLQQVSYPVRLKQAFFLLVAATLLAGCAQPGFSSVEREWERRRSSEAFALLSASPERAVVSARGRLIAIDPAEGFCLTEESIEVSQRSVFALLGDCSVVAVASGAKRSSRGELQLPRAVPGIMTVSISGDSVFGGDSSRSDTLDDLERFLATANGKQMLGRGAGGDTVSIIQSRRVGGSLFVHVRDADEDVVPLLAPRFWRAFVEVNRRLAVVTFSGFRDNPMEEDEMLRHLRAQVERLREANRVPPTPQRTLVAAVAPGRKPEVAPAADRPKTFPEALRTTTAILAGAESVRPSGEIKGLTVFIAPAPDGTPTVMPMPPKRAEIASLGQIETGPDSDDAPTRNAPLKAPQAPKRPG